MQQAWEYEKEGMGLQYNYGQQAADAEYKRNLQMWKDTNFGAQRGEMEDAGLSVGLMYGNGGGSAASTAGGSATQPSAPNTNPVEVALQQESMGLYSAKQPVEIYPPDTRSKGKSALPVFE